MANHSHLTGEQPHAAATDFLHAEGERLRQDMSQYLHLQGGGIWKAAI
jgi:hypothetical protein